MQKFTTAGAESVPPAPWVKIRVLLPLGGEEDDEIDGGGV